MKKLIELWIRNKVIILYVIFGICTTCVNFISYVLFRIAGFGTAVSTVLSWVLAVLFAYITNKRFVFESKQTELFHVVKEIISFAAGRVATGILDLAIMLICVDGLHINELVVKIFSNVIVIVMNYLISKFFVFKERN